MDAQKASYSITVMAKVLGVTRAGYDAWKNRASHRGERALVRRRLDEAVAWEHEVSGGTYGAPRIRHALTRAGVDVGVRAVAASMRRQGLTGLNTHPLPARRGGRGPVAHEDHCARQWDQGGLDRVWITDVTLGFPRSRGDEPLGIKHQSLWYTYSPLPRGSPVRRWCAYPPE